MTEEITQEQEQEIETHETETEQAVTTENAAPSQTETQERTFTQKELDEIITKRIEREREATAKRVAQEARDKWVEEQGWTDFEGNQITTEARYKEVLQEQKLREKYKELPEDVQKELIESKKFREQFEAERKQSSEKAKQQEDYQAFLKTFPDVKPEEIPLSVWDEVQKGKSLVDAYTRHENKVLKDQLTKLTEEKEIEQKNQENAASTTGSVTGQGGSGVVTYTREQVKAMSQEEVNKNWEAVQASMKHWK